MSQQPDIKLIATDRVIPDANTSPTQGHIRLQPLKMMWFLTHAILGLCGIILFPQLDALMIFLLLSAITICAGHSVGMHRLLIHRSFETPLVFEHFLVWLGVLVGMAGPMGMIRTHDMRDWHQRQTICPPHPSHAAGFWRDAWWQLCCTYKLDTPPKFIVEKTVKNDLFYKTVEQTWMAQQLPLAVILYVFGGWAWVLWGISLRIFTSLAGHWVIGHYAHKRGEQNWQIKDLPVQGYNLPGYGLITFGENWHGNHHAFPHSAKLGIEQGQFDPGYLLICCFVKLGLAWNVHLPNSKPARDGLIRCKTAAKSSKKIYP
jgi:stearoyl-CoA desaturase (delta-9 desaturase)